MKIAVIDIGGTTIKAGIVENGIISNYTEYPTNAEQGGIALMEWCCKIISEIGRFDCISVSTAGQVNPHSGVIIFANENIPRYTGIHVGDILQERFKVPVFVENDVNAAALGEGMYGAGKNFDNFLCLTYGTGVGGAIVNNKKIYHGTSFSAGEFGHIITHVGGAKCGCGGYGCYEQYASTTALVRAAKALDPCLDNGRAIFSHIDESPVRQIIDNWIGEIAVGIVSLIHIFNPPCVVVGGGIMAENYIIENLKKLVSNQIMKSFSCIEIKQAELGNKAGLMGAAYHAELKAKS